MCFLFRTYELVCDIETRNGSVGQGRNNFDNDKYRNDIFRYRANKPETSITFMEATGTQSPPNTPSDFTFFVVVV